MSQRDDSIDRAMNDQFAQDRLPDLAEAETQAPGHAVSKQSPPLHSEARRIAPRGAVATLALAISALLLAALFTACEAPGSSPATSKVSPNQPASVGTPTHPAEPATPTSPPDRQAEANSGRDQRVVVKVIDGDTIDVSAPGETAKERVRLIGIDTPETKDPRKPVQCFGKEASEFTKQLVGRTVWLEYDVERNDRYGRTLAYVFLDDGAFFNLILAEEGYAQPLTIPPNVKYSHGFVEAARNAREGGKGLWGKC